MPNYYSILSDIYLYADEKSKPTKSEPFEPSCHTLKKRRLKMNKIICINPPKFVKAILKLFVKKPKNNV